MSADMKSDASSKENTTTVTEENTNDRNPKRSRKLSNHITSNGETSSKLFKMHFSPFTLRNQLQGGEFKRKFNTSFMGFHEWNDDNIKVQLLKSPFQICILQNFIEEDENINELVKEMIEIDWDRKQMDLYEFYQTTDLINVDLPNLRHFYKFLKQTIMPWMEQLTGFELTYISASCSMYNFNDHLLVHDDLLSDRRIAFVFYLSPWENMKEWSENSGGALELFDSNEKCQPYFPVAKKIFPKNNQFLFFEVCNKSFHQVGEVTNLNYPRLSINGWFHGPILKKTNQKDIILSPSEIEIDITEWVNDCFLKLKVKSDIQQHIEVNSEASLEEFLIPDLYNVMCEELKTNPDLKWVRQGPANQRNYDSLDLTNLRGPIRDLFQLFSSKEMFKLLHEFTDLDLYGEKANTPTCSVDIQRWTQEYYTILGDSVAYEDSSLDVYMYFNSIENVGVINFLEPEEEHTPEDDDNDEVLLTLYPKDNVLNLVYRTERTGKFTKYVSKSCSCKDKFVYILACSFKE